MDENDGKRYISLKKPKIQFIPDAICITFTCLWRETIPFFFFRANHYKNLFNKIYSLIQKKFLGVNGSCQCNSTMHTYNNFTNTFTPKGKSHCMKSVQIRSYFWSVFSCILTEYGEIASLRIQSEYRKIRTRNNYVFGHFSCSE